MASERAAAKRALQLETRVPTTFDSEGLGRACEKAREEIQADRRTHLVALLLKGQNMQGGSPPAKTGKIADGRLMGPDPNSREFELLAVSHYSTAIF